MRRGIKEPKEGLQKATGVRPWRALRKGVQAKEMPLILGSKPLVAAQSLHRACKSMSSPGQQALLT